MKSLIEFILFFSFIGGCTFIKILLEVLLNVYFALKFIPSLQCMNSYCLFKICCSPTKINHIKHENQAKSALEM